MRRIIFEFKIKPCNGININPLARRGPIRNDDALNRFNLNRFTYFCLICHLTFFIDTLNTLGVKTLVHG